MIETIDNKIAEVISELNPDNIRTDEGSKMIKNITDLMKNRKIYAESEATMNGIEIDAYREEQKVEIEKLKEKNRHSERLKEESNRHSEKLTDAGRDNAIGRAKRSEAIMQFILGPLSLGFIKGSFALAGKVLGYSICLSDKLIDRDVWNIMTQREEQ